MPGMTTRWFLGMMGSAMIALGANSAVAQITPDGTLPNNSIVTPDGSTLNITGGTQAGGNLFHSFQQFSVPTGGTAFFNNAADIQNIISRVTGGSVSNIDGLIRALGNANLFLINPSGIVFGRNASLNIGGSFVATTANAIAFGNQGFFNASAPNNPELLTVKPSAFFFNQIAASPIQNDSIADSGLNLSSEYIATGLRVPDGKSLLLVGGDINMNGGGLYAFGGRVELGGLASAGTVGLNGDGNNLSLSFPNGVERSDVFLSNNAKVNVRAGDGGSITVNARNLEMTGSSFLYAGIESGLGSNSSKAGNIEVNATGAINLDNGSPIANYVQAEANGQGGDVSISANKLRVEGGAQVFTATFGAGDGGNLTIDAQNVQLIARSPDDRFATGLGASAEPNSTGDAGDLTIKTNTLLVQDGAQVITGTFGKGNGGSLTVDAQNVQLIGRSADDRFASGLGAAAQPNSTGDAGDLTIKTNTLLVRDGAQVTTATSGSGKGGSLRVDAQDMQLIGRGSGLFGSAEENSTGDAGDLIVKTNTLLVRDRAQVNASTYGSGKGGNLTVDAKDVQVIGESGDGQFPSLLSASAQPNSTGDAGSLTIKTNTLLVKDGAQVFSSTFGPGKGGNLTIDAQDVQLIGTSADGQFSSKLSASTYSTGDAGSLTIKTNTLQVKDGAQVSAITFGSGKGGSLRVDAQDVQLIGRSADSTPSGLLANADIGATGNGGNITIEAYKLIVQDGALIFAGASGGFTSSSNGGSVIINTQQLLLQNGGQIGVATFRSGNGGSLTVDASDVQLIGRGSALGTSAERNSTGDAGDLTVRTNTLLVQDGAQVTAATSGKGNGGSLTVDAQNIQLIGTTADGQFASGLFADTDSTGDAGDLMIKTNTLLVRDGARVSVASSGTGTSGNMTLNARSIRLDNDALLTANTQSTLVDPTREQATININSQNLIMRRGSNIRTNATGENVIGGNINIDTDFLVAVENSDISANSANSRGGNVRINAQAILGTQFRDAPTLKSDITATGVSREFNGNVELITPGVDLSRGLVPLTTDVVDVAGLVDDNVCARTANSSFTYTGRGGLPPSPNNTLNSDAVWEDWRLTAVPRGREEQIQRRNSQSPLEISGQRGENNSSRPTQIVEAQGWIIDKNGEVILTAYAPTATPHKLGSSPLGCQPPIAK